MDKLGHVYEKETAVNLKNGCYVIKKGTILKTAQEIYDEADLHYFKNNPKKINKHENVKVIGYWMNFYGNYIRCEYQEKIYDIKPEFLIYER